MNEYCIRNGFIMRTYGYDLGNRDMILENKMRRLAEKCSAMRNEFKKDGWARAGPYRLTRDGCVLGFQHYQYWNGFPFMGMFVIWIPPEKQGQGIGSAIFERLCGLLDQHGEEFRLGIQPIARYDVEGEEEPTFYDDPQVKAEKTAGVERFVKRFGFVKDDYCRDEQYWVRCPTK